MFKQLIVATLLLTQIMSAGSIKIAVAANVSYAIDDLKKEFNKLYPDTKVLVTFGGSGKLTAQIKNGAPFELFISANMIYPQALYENGDATTKPVIYAQGGLAYLSTKKRDFSQGIGIIKSDTIEKIAIANPKTAPYGKATVEALKNANLLESVESKFVYGESISQTVVYTATAADIGFIAKSSLHSPRMSKYKEGINWVVIDPKLYTPIDQGIVILKRGQHSSEVSAFYNFMLSSKAKDILEKFGYVVP